MMLVSALPVRLVVLYAHPRLTVLRIMVSAIPIFTQRLFVRRRGPRCLPAATVILYMKEVSRTLRCLPAFPVMMEEFLLKMEPLQKFCATMVTTHLLLENMD